MTSAIAPDARRVLVADDDPISLRLLQRALTRAGFAVDVAMDGAQAFAKVAQVDYFAVVTDWLMPVMDGIELTSRTRARPGVQPIIVLSSVLDLPSARDHALAAGADAFLPKPAVPARLLEILAAGRTLASEAPPPISGGHPLSRSSTWHALPASLAVVLGETLQAPAKVSDTQDGAGLPTDLVARCTLLDVEHQLELIAAISSSVAGVGRIAEVMLGEPAEDDETLAAMLSEVVNIAAGRLKSELGRDGYPFTLGVPTPSSHDELAAVATASALARTIVLEAADATITAHVYVRPSRAVDIAAVELREGLVLAEDLLHDDGTLILPACTRLTGSAVQRLRDLLGARRVRVCVPDQLRSALAA